MKITYLYQYFGTPNGSWSTRVYEMCKIWIEKGVEVTVITSPYDKSDIAIDKLVEKIHFEGINLIIINAGDSNRFGLFKRAYRSILFAIISTYYAIKIKSDIVIASSGPITIGIPGLLSTWFSKKKLVFEVRDLWPSGAIELGLIKSRFIKWLFLKFEALCYRRSKLVVPLSMGMEEHIKSRFPEVETLVIPNACDNDLFKTINVDFQFPEWLNNSDKVLIYAGSLGLMDACDEIIHGFNLVENKTNVKLVFIGDGIERKHLEELVKKYQLDEYVYFLGLIPKTDVVRWYHRSLVSFVVFKNFPILGTSSPNKMFDSFAANIPIIQNTKGWIRELINHFGVGINVEPNNPKEMSAAIETFLELEMNDSKFKTNIEPLALIDFDRIVLANRYLSKLNEHLT